MKVDLDRHIYRKKKKNFSFTKRVELIFGYTSHTINYFSTVTLNNNKVFERKKPKVN